MGAGVLAITAALVLSLSAGASALGPGGWDHLGTGATATAPALNGRVDALLSVPAAGALAPSVYAGGVFTSAGGDVSAVSIARWDGTAWHSLGAPALNSGVDAIAVDNGKIYVGGSFTNAGGNAAADFVAVWDGLSWQSVCAPISANVRALQIIGRTLYIGGDFDNGAGLPAADKLVACGLDTGTPSSAVDSDGDTNGSVYGLTADAAGRLYAAGSFIDIDHVLPADHVAMYDGAWHAMGATGAVTDITRAIASDGTNVYIGSDSLNIGGVANADHVARWDGSAWGAVGANPAGNDGYFPASTFINAIAASGANLYVAGSFQNAGGQAAADEVAQFNGSSWSPLGSDGAGNGPLPSAGNAIALFGHEAIVGGNFTSAGGDPLASYVAQIKLDNRPPVAVITGGDLYWFLHNSVDADATSSKDPDGTIVSYRWNFGDIGRQDQPGSIVSHRYDTSGTFTATLTVTDNDGATGTAQRSYTVREGPSAAFTWSPQTPVVGQNVTFRGQATDPDGTIVAHSWYGYGTPFTGPNSFVAPHASSTLTHAFPETGVVNVAYVAAECDTCNTQCNCPASDGHVLAVTIAPAAVPKVTKASMTSRTFRVAPAATAIAAKAPRGTKLKVTLRAPATLTIAIARTSAGVRRGKRCVAISGRPKPRAKRCTRSTKAGTLTRKGLQPGVNTIAFSGRVGKRALKPGSYVAALTARNATGRAKPTTVRFTIVR